MVIGVTIDMRNSNALCTVGVLSALLENGHKDYTELIAPFILAATPDTVGQKIDLSSIQETVREEYGFEDMPLDFIRGVLQRYTRKGGYFRREKYQYYVVTPFDKTDIVSKQEQMRKEIDCILKDMQEYFSDNFIHDRFSLQVIKEMLEEFFECCGFVMAKDISNLQTISANSYGKRVFWVARYVLSKASGHTLEKKYLIEIVKGFLVCKALYYFENNNKTSLNSKLKSVVCYLDCSLVISSLGYNSEEREDEVQELIHLIRKSGGKVCVFEHTVTEAESLLDSFARHPDRINAFQLDGLAAKKYSTDILLAIASSVEENLKKKQQIETIPNPSYFNAENYIGIQDESAIAEWLENCRKNHRRSRVPHRERFDYDAKSLSSIGMVRKGSHPERIERCKAILVTQDPFLSRCMKALCPNQFPPEVDFAILDVDLVSLLWLENYNAKSSLPIDILIANATALNLASPEIMERAFELTEQLVKSGEISEDAALTIRSQPRIRKYLGEITQNDITVLSHASIHNALSKYVETESSKYVEDATSGLKKELEDAKREIQKLKDEKNEKLKRHTEKISQRADKIAYIFENCIIAILSLILLFSIVVWSLKFVADYPPFRSSIWNYIFILLDILSLLQIIDYFRNPSGIIKKASKRIRDWTFTWYYSYKISKYDELS